MKRATDTMTLRLPVDLKQAVTQQAIKTTRTTAGQILYYIKQGLTADGALKNELGNMGPRS
jgi:predicted DNA-binding protein